MAHLVVVQEFWSGLSKQPWLSDALSLLFAGEEAVAALLTRQAAAFQAAGAGGAAAQPTNPAARGVHDLLVSDHFWSGIFNLAWLLALVVILFSFKETIIAVLTGRNFTLKVSGMEVSVLQAADATGKGLADVQARLAVLEKAFTESGVVPERPPGADSVGGKPFSMLWVDDSPANNAFLIEKLERDGIFVRKALSTDAAMGALGSGEKFDLIVGDLSWSDYGRENPFAGADFARALRASGNRTPLLIFAGRRALENRDSLFKAGADRVAASAVEVFKFVDDLRAGGAGGYPPPRG